MVLERFWKKAVEAARDAEGLQVKMIPHGHLTRNARELVDQIREERFLIAGLTEKYRKLASLHNGGQLYEETHKKEHSGDIKGLRPTHLAIDRHGNVMLLRRIKESLLAKFLSWQPFKTRRQPLSI